MMKNSENIRKRLDEIKSMDDPKKALSMLADVQYEIGSSACEERIVLKKDIENLRKVITGNGDPSNSIMARQNLMLRRLNEVETGMTKVGDGVIEIRNALMGDIKKPGQKGMIERLGDVEKDIKDVEEDTDGLKRNLSKFIWLVVGAVITTAVGAIVAASLAGIL